MGYTIGLVVDTLKPKYTLMSIDRVTPEVGMRLMIGLSEVCTKPDDTTEQPSTTVKEYIKNLISECTANVMLNPLPDPGNIDVPEPVAKKPKNPVAKKPVAKKEKIYPEGSTTRYSVHGVVQGTRADGSLLSEPLECKPGRKHPPREVALYDHPNRLEELTKKNRKMPQSILRYHKATDKAQAKAPTYNTFTGPRMCASEESNPKLDFLRSTRVVDAKSKPTSKTDAKSKSPQKSKPRVSEIDKLSISDGTSNVNRLLSKRPRT